MTSPESQHRSTICCPRSSSALVNSQNLNFEVFTQVCALPRPRHCLLCLSLAFVDDFWHKPRRRAVLAAVARPAANGISRTANPPIEWSETQEHPLEGGDPGPRVVISGHLGRSRLRPDRDPRRHERRRLSLARAAASIRERFIASSSWRFDRRDGRIVWERTAREEPPHEASHQDNGTWASASAVTDGEHVIASFESRGIYAYDMNGKLVWEKDLGDKSMRNEFGEGSTPALYEIILSSCGITPKGRSSRRSIRAPAKNSGASAATKSTRGRRRSWSSTAAVRR